MLLQGRGGGGGNSVNLVLDLKTHSNFDHIVCDINEPIHCVNRYTDNHIHDNVHQVFNNYVTES